MAGRPPGDSADGRQRLLDACWSLLLENRAGERLTIAAVCERARCTPPTLYHHFGDLAALEAAASSRAFLEWQDALSVKLAQVEDPHERLALHGNEYLDWALQNPDAYFVLFNRPRQEINAAPRFPDLVHTLAEIHGLDEDDASAYTLGLTFWASVHGLANLMISYPSIPDAARKQLLAHYSAALNKAGPPEKQDWAVELMNEHEEEEPGRARPRRLRF